MMYIFHCKLIVSYILLVETESTHCSLISITSIRSTLTHICVTQIIVTCIVDIHTKACADGKTFNRSQFSKPVCIQHVSQKFSLIINKVTCRVGNRHKCTWWRTAYTITVIIHLTTVQCHNLFVSSTYIHRINRSNVIGNIESITGRWCIILIARIVTLWVYIVHVGTHFQPVCYLVVTLQTTAETSQTRTFNYTLIIQIAESHVESRLIVTARHIQVIFLTKRCSKCFISPVIRSIIISIFICIAQCSIRVQQTVATNQQLTFRYCINLITYTTISSRKQSIVCSYIGSLRSHAIGLYITIIDSFVSFFQIILWTCQHIVVLYSTRVGTPFCIEVYTCLTRSTFFSSNHDDTVCTTRTIQRCRSRIFQHCHWFNICRVDRWQISIIRHTVYYIQRVCSGIDWSDTTDTHFCIFTRLTVITQNLHTCYSSSQCIWYVWHLTFLNLISFHHCCRTCKWPFGRSTIRSYHNFIKYLSIRLQHHFYDRLNLHFLRLHSDERNDQSSGGTILALIRWLSNGKFISNLLMSHFKSVITAKFI